MKAHLFPLLIHCTKIAIVHATKIALHAVIHRVKISEKAIFTNSLIVYVFCHFLLLPAW